MTDFGLAKQTKGGSELTGTGQILGTPSYMPPEQADGKLATVGPLADVYSLGAILYCMLTGRPPFQSSNPIDTLMQVLKSQPIAPRQLNPAIPRDLETICLKAIEKQPSKRYASAAELREELLRFMTGEPILARPISSIERGWRWLKRHPSAGTFAGVVLGSLGIITGVTISSNRKLQKERDVANHATIEANEQRNAAQRRLDKAIEAVDKLLVRVASEQWAARPELQSEKKYLLEQAVGFYLSFIEESRGDTKVRLEAAKAQMRLGNVYLMLNDFDASLQSVNAAQRLFKDLMSEQPQEASIRNLCSEATILKANTLALTARYQESNDEYLASIRQADEALQLAPENIEYKIRKLESQSSYGYFLLSFDPKKGKETIAQLMQNADEIEGNGARYEARLAIGFALTVDAAYKLVDSNMPAAAQSYGKAAQLLETLRDQTPPSPRTLSSFTIPTRSSRFSVGSCRVSAIGTNRPNGKGWHACSRGFSLFDRLLVINPKAFPYRMQKFQALRGIASLQRELGEEDRARVSDSEADRIVEQLIAENPNLEWLQGMDAMRQSLKFVQAIRDGEIDQLEEIANRLLQASTSRQQGDVRYNVACAYALASSMNQERRESFARRSLELLQELKEKKYFEVPARAKLLGNDNDLDALRERSDFQSFQRSLEVGKTSPGSLRPFEG